MSEKNNVNPGNYKIGGRDRQGEDILHEAYKQQYAQAQAEGKTKEPRFPASQENPPDAEATDKAEEASK
jgi:hypothetical protein